MAPIKRRHFLQFVGASALTTLGLGNINLPQQGQHEAQVLAQTIPRKLALLIGINAYLRKRFVPLKGCLTDVELQRHLLIHRFGFNPKDILSLTDTQATRQGILDAFEAHLIKQAQPGDVVVFHFSGNGSQVVDPHSNFPNRLNNTLVPVDSSMQTDGSVRDITEHTLWLLMTALKTENVTVVLDISRSGSVTSIKLPSSSGIFTEKSLEETVPKISPEEEAYQQQWLARLGSSPSEFIQQQGVGITKGVLIASTQRDQLMSNAVLGDIDAGMFTYLMTQYLWQQTGKERAENAIANIVRSVTELSFTAQKPQFTVKPHSDNEKRPIYFIEQQTPPAEAVITNVEDDQVELWLGGIEPKSLEVFAQNAILAIVDSQGKEQGLVQLESRQGLVGRGKVLEATCYGVQSGTLLQERIRGIPGNLTLRLGLAPSLGNDTLKAQQALQAIKRIEVLPLEPSTKDAAPSRSSIDYILGCMTAAEHQKLQQSQGSALPSIGSIGLFLPGLMPVPDSFGTAGEIVTDAVHRLQPKLKSLLATRVVKLALNTHSSRLKVASWMTLEGKGQGVIAEAFAVRGFSNRLVPEQALVTSVGASGATSVLPIKTPVQLHITNNEPCDLYCSILVIDSTREISVIFPNQWAAAEDVTRVNAGQTLLVPDSSKDAFSLVTQEPKGVTEVMIIASSQPLRKTLLSLRSIASRGGQRRGPIPLNALDDSINVVDNLLNDLNTNPRPGASLTVNDNQDVHRLDSTQLAVMSMHFEVI